MIKSRRLEKQKSSKTKPFTLTSKGLEKVFDSLHIALPQDSNPDWILFAFRGCLPQKLQKGWVKKAALQRMSVDHIHMRCCLGIWDRTHQRFFLATGSTVPHKDQVEKSVARKGRLKGKGSNQLEPGFYTDLTKGEHLQGKINGHAALRQTANRFYRRNLVGLPYTLKSPLFFGNPYDNLHCGWNQDGKKPGYSSAGCLVIAGLPYCPRHENPQPNQGAWKIFHDLIYNRSQKVFPILLIEAITAEKILQDRALSLSKRESFLFGSRGTEVKKLQSELIQQKNYRGRVNGILDARTFRAMKKNSFD